MRTPHLHPTSLCLGIITAFLLTLICGAGAEDGSAALEIKNINPAPPAQLKAGERLTVAVDYRNPEKRRVQIWVRPYTKGKITSGYRAHGSSIYSDASGQIEGWFFFNQPTVVDEVRVEMVENVRGGERKVLASSSQQISGTWTGTRTSNAATPAIAASPKPSSAVTVGQPLEMKFTALDGREVELAKLRGKVVLIEFWATSCGPCIAELPQLVEAYRKFHDRGFEILGISFDNDKDALERMIKQKGMTWPQHFDGKGWQNEFGRKYRINAIPTMWFISKDGLVAAINARRNLAEQVENLLAGKDAAASLPPASVPSQTSERAASDD